MPRRWPFHHFARCYDTVFYYGVMVTHFFGNSCYFLLIKVVVLGKEGVIGISPKTYSGMFISHGSWSWASVEGPQSTTTSA